MPKFMDTDITVGLPSYKRPFFLEKALNFLTKETNNLVIKVSIDGKDETYQNYKKVEKKFINFKNIEFIYQETNLGSLKNFFYLRDIAKTDFFMWLADDDLIDYETIKNLQIILKRDKSAVTAVPYWRKFKNEKESNLIRPNFFPEKHVIQRVLKYMLNSDDAFFYGLHRFC
jgi:GT2 family glycosyltransferase